MADSTTSWSGTLRQRLLTLDSRGRDPLTRVLVWAIVLVLVGILGALGLTIWQLTRGGRAPRTEAERQMMVLSALTKTRPTDPRIWTSYTAVLIDTGQYGLASQAIEQGLAATKNAAALMVQQARLYHTKGQQDLALAEVSRAIAKARDEDRLRDEGLVKKGVKVWPVANEDIIAAEVLRATIMEQALRWKDAIAAYTTALRERGDMSDVLTSRAKDYIQLKEYGKAKADLTRAVRMAPDYAPAVQALEQLKKETGK